jgi:hypothetical protein
MAERPLTPVENRRRIALMRVDEGGKQKYNPPAGGHPKGNPAFARKDKGRGRRV